MQAYQKHLDAFDAHLTLKNFSKSTRTAYRCALRQFFVYRDREGLSGPFTQEQAREYILYRYKQGLKWQTINGDYSAMYKFYREVLRQDWDVEHIPRPRKERTLPPVLSQAEVQRIIECGGTFKHQVFMMLLYGTGLRLSEALNLGQAWARRSAQWSIQNARSAAGVEREVSPHVFRHCYATHHLENGTSLVYLKEQLGHKHLKTTAKYIHLCKSYQKQVRHPVADMVHYRTDIL